MYNTLSGLKLLKYHSGQRDINTLSGATTVSNPHENRESTHLPSCNWIWAD